MKLIERIRSLRKRIPAGLVGAALLFGGTTIVNAGNYAFNLLMGRWLGPAAFADASLIITLFLALTFIAVALQTAAAKFAATYIATKQTEQFAGLRFWLRYYASWAGGCLFVIFGLGAPLWQLFFHTHSAWPFVIFGFGIPFFFVLSVDRGMLQGQEHFAGLTLSYQVEMWMRLISAMILVGLGFSVGGAVAGLTISLIAAWLIVDRLMHKVTVPKKLEISERNRVLGFAVPVVAALIGQILINNSDILIVKHFFDASQAGLYAALALIGRIVFFATWSVVTVLFPIVTRRHQSGQAHRHLLYIGLGSVLLVSTLIVGVTGAVPELIVTLLFGEEYRSVASLLVMYALATAFYALANVVINYHLSLDNNMGSLLALFGGIAQVGALLMFHTSLQQVVMVQVWVMGGLLGALLVWDSWLLWQDYTRSLSIKNAYIAADTGGN